MHEIEALDREDALAFYAASTRPTTPSWSSPATSTADEVRALAEETYGKVARRAEPGAAAAAGRAAAAAPRAASRSPTRRSTQPSLQRAYLVPSYARGRAPARPRRSTCWPTILGGGATSRLYRALVVEQGVAASAGAWYQGSALDATRLRRLRHAAARTSALDDARGGGRRRAAPTLVENGVADEELDARQDAARRRRRLRPGQPVLARPHLRRALTIGGTVDDVARLAATHRAPSPPTTSSASPASCSTSGARSPATLSAPAEDEALVIRCTCRTHASGADLASPCSVAARHRCLAGQADPSIQRVVSPGGIEAWLVEEHAVPLVAAGVRLRAAAPRRTRPARPGSPTCCPGLLDEGAGDLDADAFQERLDELGDRAVASRPSRDPFSGSLRTLAENRDEAFGCCALALTEPRFDAEPVERVRAQVAGRHAPRAQRSRTRSPAAPGGRGLSRPSLRPAGATARSRASPPIDARTICAAYRRAHRWRATT